MATILLIHNDLTLQIELKTLLEFQGHKLVSVNSGKEALNLLRYANLDLMICDIDIPEIGGFDFLKKIKKKLLHKQAPVMLLTSTNDHEVRLKGFELGVIGYLAKPVDINEIQYQINNLFTYRNTIIDHTLYGSHENQNTDFQFVKDFYDLLALNFGSPDFSLNKAAEALSMSVSTLKRRLTIYLDTTFSDAVKEYRFRKASDLLKKSSLSIEEISIACGFRSLSYFSRSFKANYFLSPVQYKNDANDSRLVAFTSKEKLAYNEEEYTDIS
ncbi:response regulator transcription factor [Spirosoma fluviale]|uniref:Two component transcriptional regulator, AraC family n=1 Tax=Spirosoma fluviale TaxID=1597977 RepID=A0A286GRZ7_9BACT|nr:response regulator [Spirosoma fluviale]SOD98345.1 two component transcriptional regulator, AraC family [Spirosoma fluviale]